MEYIVVMGSDDPNGESTLPLGPSPQARSPSSLPPAEPPAATNVPGRESATPELKRLGRFEIKAKLGEGGMGVVLLATDPQLGRRVALKVLRREVDSSDTRRRLLREAQGVAQLTHENVIVVHEVGTHEGHDYVAMEYVAGGTLTDWQVGKPWNEIVAMYLRAGRGLCAAHDAGLVHRDFKPDNVLVGSDGRVRVSDFGLVASVGDAQSLSATERSMFDDLELAVSLTRTGSIMGTPRYMAPEQHLGEVADPRADQFAFCASLYAALYREPPFVAEVFSVLVAKVLAGEIGPVPADSPVPPSVRDAILRGLSRQRDDRFPSMRELLAILEPAATATPPLPHIRRRPWIVLTGAALAVAIAVGLVLGATRAEEPTSAAITPCPDPMIDPDQVLPDSTFAALSRSHQAPGARSIRATLQAWRDVRQRVCAGSPAEHKQRTVCLDAVLSAIDADAKALASIAGTSDDRRAAQVLAQLDGPELCLASALPKLGMYSPARQRVIASQIRADASALDARVIGLDELRTEVASDPCAAAALELAAVRNYWHRYNMDSFAELPPATPTQVEQCDDDLLRRELAIHDVMASKRGTADATAQQRYKRLSAAAARLPSTHSKMSVLIARAHLAALKGDIASAIADVAEAVAMLAKADAPVARVQAAMYLAHLRRGPWADSEKTRLELAEIRASVARDLPGDTVYLSRVDRAIAAWLARNSREQEAHDLYEKTASTNSLVPNIPPRRVTGRVVDGHGAPVAGAKVFAEKNLRGNSYAASAAPSQAQRNAITAADGTFVILDAVVRGSVVAELGVRRSRPREIADHVELVLEDTSVLAGHVESNGTSTDGLYVWAVDSNEYVNTAHVRRDGTFEMRGILRGNVTLVVIEVHENDATAVHQTRKLAVGPTVPAITLAANPPRSTRVLVRSAAAAPMSSATIWIVPGRVKSGRLSKLGPKLYLSAAQSPKLVEPAQLAELGPTAKAGDFYREIRVVPPGEASVCASALHVDEDATVWAKILAHADAIEVRCAAVPTDARLVVLEVSPLPRLD